MGADPRGHRGTVAALPRGVRRPRGGGGRHRGVRDARALRPLAAGEVRGAVRALRRSRASPRYPPSPRGAPGEDRHARAARCLRDERDGPRLERPAGRDHRHLRRRRRGVRGRHSPRVRQQGLHRQRRSGRAAGRRLRAARRRRGEARGPRAARAPSRRRREARRRRADRGLRPQARPERGGQRAHLVRRRASPARGPPRPLRARSAPRACTRARSRTRTAGSSRCSAP